MTAGVFWSGRRSLPCKGPPNFRGLREAAIAEGRPYYVAVSLVRACGAARRPGLIARRQEGPVLVKGRIIKKLVTKPVNIDKITSLARNRSGL